MSDDPYWVSLGFGNLIDFGKENWCLVFERLVGALHIEEGVEIIFDIIFNR